MERLLSLDDRAVLDARVAGNKAALLGRARSAGLPVLPGRVLPSPEGKEAMLAGAQALERSGHAAACLAVSNVALDPLLTEVLQEAAAELSGRIVVRSSTPYDADPRWSGAFSTYHDVAAEDISVAVRGCWASGFSRDVVARCSRLGERVEDLRVAVLIQPWLALDGGGTAALAPDGRITVTAVAGDPASLVGGRSPGAVAEVASDGSTEGDPSLDGLGSDVLRCVASLVREVARDTGELGIEWGTAHGRVLLLQIRHLVSSARAARAARVGRPRIASAEGLRIARLADRYPAPLGDVVVLPWGLALPGVPEAPRLDVKDPGAALSEVRALSAELTRQAWNAPTEIAAERARVAIRRVLGPAPDEGLAGIAALRPIDRGTATRLLGLVGGIGDALVGSGQLRHRELVWRLSIEELARAIEQQRWEPPARLGPDRWEPFVFAMIEAAGPPHEGTPASPGIGAGRLLTVEGSSLPSISEPRRVLAVPGPLPQVAPLLWGCAGLVVRTGSPGSHLFEVARSLGVPAVIAPRLGDAQGGALVAVDGHRGVVTMLPGREVVPGIAAVGA